MADLTVDVFEVRTATNGVRIIVVQGDVTPASEDALMDAYNRACEAVGGVNVRGVVLDFTGLDYMNSGGIGLLVTLLVRAQRSKLRLTAFGLSEHYRQIFELTRLDDAIAIHEDEVDAVAALDA